MDSHIKHFECRLVGKVVLNCLLKLKTIWKRKQSHSFISQWQTFTTIYQYSFRLFLIRTYKIYANFPFLFSFSFIFLAISEFRCQLSEQLNATDFSNYCRLFDFRAISHSIFVAFSMEVSINQSFVLYFSLSCFALSSVLFGYIITLNGKHPIPQLKQSAENPFGIFFSW